MAGDVSVTTQNVPSAPVRRVEKYALAWTADGSGDVSGVLKRAAGNDLQFSGTIVRAVFVPGEGAVQPLNNYNVKLLDAQGIDVLGSQGLTRSNTTASSLMPGQPLADGTTVSVAPVPVDGTLDLTIDSAGADNQGTVYLYLR